MEDKILEFLEILEQSQWSRKTIMTVVERVVNASKEENRHLL
jgi:hypothetical protein